MFGSIINLISSIINLGASENNQDLSNTIKKTDTNLKIEENNKIIRDDDVTMMAHKIHEFNTLCPKKEEGEQKDDNQNEETNLQASVEVS